jgi:hypothetical protein
MGGEARGFVQVEKAVHGGEGKREKGKGKREKGEGKREKGEGKREKGKGSWTLM